MPDTVKARAAKKEKSINSVRSYVATINGKELTGMGETGKVTKRYFHGEPAAAARKVVGQLYKGGEDVGGIDNAVKIELTEVTRGVRKADKSRFTYTYFGWRETTTAKTIKFPGKDGREQKVTYTGKHVAVPARGKSSAAAANAASKAIGEKIKAAKE
jgi:hypothetical protein